MGKLTRFLWISALLLLLPLGAMAAQVTITFDEPIAAGNDCDHLRIYFCFGTDCNPQAHLARVAASDANCGEADRSLGPFNLDVPENRVPGQVCFRVTVVNTAGNESAGVKSCVAVTGS